MLRAKTSTASGETYKIMKEGPLKSLTFQKRALTGIPRGVLSARQMPRPCKNVFLSDFRGPLDMEFQTARFEVTFQIRVNE